MKLGKRFLPASVFTLVCNVLCDMLVKCARKICGASYNGANVVVKKWLHYKQYLAFRTGVIKISQSRSGILRLA